MGGSPKSKNKPRPSYEDGQLRDPSIAEKADPDFSSTKLLEMIRKASEPKG